jgi:hypothetical protein
VGVVVKVDFGGDGPRRGDVVADPQRLLSGAEIAALLGVKPATWRSLVRQGYAPEPDDPGGDGPLKGRRPRWRLSTVRRFKQSRKGAGFRSDLVR